MVRVSQDSRLPDMYLPAVTRSAMGRGTARDLITKIIFKTETAGLLLYKVAQPTKEYFKAGPDSFGLIEYDGDSNVRAICGEEIRCHKKYYSLYATPVIRYLLPD